LGLLRVEPIVCDVFLTLVAEDCYNGFSS